MPLHPVQMIGIGDGEVPRLWSGLCICKNEYSSLYSLCEAMVKPAVLGLKKVKTPPFGWKSYENMVARAVVS